MCRRSQAILVLCSAVLLVSPACKPKQKLQPVVVHIFRDLNSPYARDLDHRILEFQASNPRLSNGALVQVQSYPSTDYQRADGITGDPEAEVFVLNSPDDAKTFPGIQGELTHAVNVCAAFHACPQEVPAFIPSKVTGQKADAATKFIDYLAAQH